MNRSIALPTRSRFFGRLHRTRAWSRPAALVSDARHQRGRRLFALAPLAAAIIAGSCDWGLDPDDEEVRVSSASIDNSAGPIFRTLALSLDGPALVEVDYWADDLPRLRIHSTAPASAHTIPLARLRPNRRYAYEVRTVTLAGRRSRPYAGEFTTGALPEDLAAVSFTATGRPETPLALVHLYAPEGFRGYAAIDADGEVVWFFRTQDFPYAITRHANGNFVAMDKGRGLLEITPAGEVLHELPQDVAHRNLHHEAIATPRNTILFLAQEARDYAGRTIMGEAIWEWTPEAGETVRRWSSHDFLDPAVDWGPRSTDNDWLHANALHIGARGNILLSLRRLNQVISIAPDWSRIEWRLGGIGATIQVPEDDPFTGQHTPAEVGPGRILLFDNRHELGGYSRAVEFELAGNQARKVWEWRPARDNFAFAVSSARRLPNGNTLVGFGMRPGLNGSTGPIEVYEVSSGGDVLWHVVIDGVDTMYRAEPLETIAGEFVVAP
jgi:hypothetical protein